LFRHLLLQIGGANIANPPTSSSLQTMKRVCSLRSLATSGRQAELLAEQPAAALDERLGQRAESAGGRLVRTGLNQRNTRVTGSTELRIKRYLREQ
jgi:hypothetical protein